MHSKFRTTHQTRSGRLRGVAEAFRYGIEIVSASHECKVSPIFPDDAKSTGGVMRIDFGRKISITPEVGPGTYQNVGIITVSRN